MNNQGSPIPSYGVSLNTTQVVDNVNLTTAIQEVPQIQTTVTENGPEITTIVNAPFVQVTSVNGKTGDVTVDANVQQFKANKQYSEGSLCVYNGSLYIAKANFTSTSTFNASDWIQVQGGGGGGGASVQSDWKASNPSDPAYIKNKPTTLAQIDPTYTAFTPSEKSKLAQTKILTQNEKDKLATTEVFTSAEKSKLASTEVFTQDEKNKISQTQIFTPIEKNKLGQTLVFSQQDKTKLDNLESISPADKAKLQLLEEPFTTAEKNKLAQTQIFTQQEKTKLQNLESITSEDKAKLALLDQPYTTAEKNKLAGIETGAQKNVPQVQSDWNETSSSHPSFVKNKPNIGGMQAQVSDNSSTIQVLSDSLSSVKSRVDVTHDNNGLLKPKSVSLANLNGGSLEGVLRTTSGGIVSPSKITSSNIDASTILGFSANNSTQPISGNLAVQAGWVSFYGNGLNSQSIAINFPKGFKHVYAVVPTLIGYTFSSPTSQRSFDQKIGPGTNIECGAFTTTGTVITASTTGVFGGAYHGISWIAVGTL